MTGKLTKKQTKVLSLRAEGFLNKQIASHLDISASAVQDHLRAICKKLSAKNTVHSVAIASSARIIFTRSQMLDEKIDKLGLEYFAHAMMIDNNGIELLNAELHDEQILQFLESMHAIIDAAEEGE